MKKLNDTEGYGECDEIDGPGECEGCEGCNTPVAGRDHPFTPADPESMKTQPVRVRMTDLSLLHKLQLTEDETPGGVIHRVLEEYDEVQRAQIQSAGAEDHIKQYESLIEKQKEKITTMRREIGELKHTAKVLNSALGDANENLGEGVKEYVERIAVLQKEKEEALVIIRQMTADHQADLVERGRMLQDLEDEIDEMTDESENIRLGGGGTININIFKGSATGAP